MDDVRIALHNIVFDRCHGQCDGPEGHQARMHDQVDGLLLRPAKKEVRRQSQACLLPCRSAPEPFRPDGRPVS